MKETNALHVHPIPDDTAHRPVREIYDADLATRGYIANFTRLFSLRPKAYTAWKNLIGTISGAMDLRRYELATFAAASALRCRYCVAAHGSVLESNFFTHEQVEAITRDYRSAGLEEVEVAIMSFAAKVARHAYRVTPSDVNGLRSHGLTDAEILDVTLAAAARSFFSKTLDALGAEPDAAYESTAELFTLLEPSQGA